MEVLSAYLTNQCIQRNIITLDKKDVCKTGFELIIADAVNFFLVTFIGVATKSLTDSLIYLLLLWFVRRFSGGYHAKTYWRCRIVTVGTYLLILMTGKIINDNLLTYTIIFNLIALISMIIFAPVRHPNKELTDIEAKANKLFALLTTFIFSIASIALTILERKEGLIISLTLLAIAILMYIGLLVNRKEGKRNVKDNR